MPTFSRKPLTVAIGVAVVTSLASAAYADSSNPFGAEPLARGYDLLADAPGSIAKPAEATCGEGKCGGEMKAEAADDAKGPGVEGKCAEGKCAEGKCGEDTGDGDGDDEAETEAEAQT
jgi:uncharacterized low-complexity protein